MVKRSVIINKGLNTDLNYKKYFLVIALIICLGLPVSASPYTDYCDKAVNQMIEVLKLSDDYLLNYPVNVNVDIMPDGSVKDVYITDYMRRRQVKWENKILETTFPSHNLMKGIAGGPAVSVIQRLIKKSELQKLEQEKFLFKLRSALMDGFSYPATNQNLKAKVRYTVDKMGRLRNYELVESSGNTSFDNAVLKFLDNRQNYTIMYLPTLQTDTYTDTVTFRSK